MSATIQVSDAVDASCDANRKSSSNEPCRHSMTKRSTSDRNTTQHSREQNSTARYNAAHAWCERMSCGTARGRREIERRKKETARKRERYHFEVRAVVRHGLVLLLGLGDLLVDALSRQVVSKRR
jgi:hypothetical protein